MWRKAILLTCLLLLWSIILYLEYTFRDKSLSWSDRFRRFVLRLKTRTYDFEAAAILVLLVFAFSYSLRSIKMPVEAGVDQVLERILPHLDHLRNSAQRTGPIVLGVSGLQGSGKSTWATQIVKTLKSKHKIRAITVSLDDFYRVHDELVSLRNGNPQNKLFRTRGQPGTHDEQLAHDFFESLKTIASHQDVHIPVFDKSAFNGEGDRAPRETWPKITAPVDVLVFEGWCVGFQPLSADAVQQKWHVSSQGLASLTNTLQKHEIGHLLEVNTNLARYCEAFMGPQFFDFFVHLDTLDLRNVYAWRLQQEHALIRAKGTGMTDEQVEGFIKGYMPGYELYLDGLRKGVFSGNDKMKGKRHIRVLFDRDRTIQEVKET